MSSSTAQNKRALVLSGGGARASYQVGVLRAVANLLPRDTHNPFPIITGTSAGALNAASLATHAQRLRTGVRTLEYVWQNISSSQVYRLDSSGLIGNASNWVFSFLANRRRDTPTSLLNNEPLEQLLGKVIKFDRIQRSIDAGFMDALAITASGYTSGESVSFFQAIADIENWQRPHRVGVRTELNLQHLLASTAIPTLFPAVRIKREFFGDGAIRQLAPLSPAIHLGADRIFAIGVSSNRQYRPPADASPAHPSLTQILAHILNSAFVDTLTSDLETLRRFNKLIPLLPAEVQQDPVQKLRHIELLEIAPSQNLSSIAAEHFGDLPRALRMFIKDAGSSTILSLLMFEKAYCRRLIELGYNDAMEKEVQILEFFRES
ncbi:MAG: patatin-like phospholipase family protein [Gammaproteobacteria bacterium]|nr:patatin-like phospholipase family protein [Gammaproteobacteria bacterium]MDP2141215.1 patatin-like phospholipase family protein [Gammaproteobacteria bacterium]MDP2349111.1 patatin-like phospholipase family protein [Gammaproteobacteria bacterium]